mgnify:FL=1
MIQLGVNIDHVATVRQARRTTEPDPVHAAFLAELGGADGITLHVREDRRHVQERDLRILRQTVRTWLNLEMALDPGILEIACEVRPDQACLVPERREEVTTEGGLVVVGREDRIRPVVDRLKGAGIRVSLFIDPDPRQVEAAARVGADMVELNTGEYSNARGDARLECLERLRVAAASVGGTRLELHAGHGLDYHNIHPILELYGLRELNIGHSIVARSIYVGLRQAVADMVQLIQGTGRLES